MQHVRAGEAQCWVSRIQQNLRTAGLRPTRQRLLLASLLFRDGDRHVTAEELHAEAEKVGIGVSLATVYNALGQFTEAGLLRVLAVGTARTYYDTNTASHHHFYIEGEGRIMDIETGIRVDRLPEPPAGMEIGNVDVVIRLRRSGTNSSGI